VGVDHLYLLSISEYVNDLGAAVKLLGNGRHETVVICTILLRCLSSQPYFLRYQASNKI
jgi:hypothetical protein